MFGFLYHSRSFLIFMHKIIFCFLNWSFKFTHVLIKGCGNKGPCWWIQNAPNFRCSFETQSKYSRKFLSPISSIDFQFYPYGQKDNSSIITMLLLSSFFMFHFINLNLLLFCCIHTKGQKISKANYLLPKNERKYFILVCSLVHILG